MKKSVFFSLSILLVFLFVTIFSFTSFANECDEIRQSVLRLHILANSDSKEDQALKLKMRDAVLKEGSDIFNNASDRETAQQRIEKNSDRLVAIAKRVIKENGYDYDVQIKFSNEFFNTRTYDDVTLPAGMYDAVRILIGSGEGKNWWCVMFPPMCLPAAESSAQIDDVLTKNEVKIVKSNPEYEVRFKIVEVFEKIKNSIRSF